MYRNQNNLLSVIWEPINQYSGRKKILFVDPDMSSYFLVNEVLAEHDIETIHAKCGVEAICLFKDNPLINCLVTEVRVPELDGFEILRAIRKINPSIFAIVQTAFVQNNMKHQCLQAGFNDYITKPIDLKLFADIVIRYVLLSAEKN